MPLEKRGRLVRTGLQLVLGDRAREVTVSRAADQTVWVRDDGHGFGFPADPLLGDDSRTVLEYDVEWLIDELCEFRVAWAKRLPECPLHPDSHPLTVAFTEATVIAICPVSGAGIRTVEY